MGLAEIEKRLVALERSVSKLKSQVARLANGRRRWWVDDAGRFADDALFDEIVRLGRGYRSSLRHAKSGRGRL